MEIPPTSEQRSGAVVGHELVIVTASSVTIVPWPAAGDELVIGRAADAQVRLSGDAVSRRHAIVRREAAGFTIEDLGSSNGCYLGGSRIPANARVPMHPGDAVHVGSHVVLLRSVHRDDAVAIIPPDDPPVVAAQATIELYATTDAIAASTLGVLVVGETGVGKNVFARSLHDRSPRRTKPFVRVTCAGLSEDVLFGHGETLGVLEMAAGGTVFFDEVGELSPAIQATLTHVLEASEVRRAGATRPTAIDVRLIATTSRDLGADATAGAFRSALYYRIAQNVVRVPPLRERRDEIVALAEDMAQRAARGRPAPPITPEARKSLVERPWPGNARELRNTIERAVVLSMGGPIMLQHLPPHSIEPAPAPTLVDDADADPPPFDLTPAELAERERLIAALKAASGNQSHAARALGISRSTLLNRLDALRIARPRKRPRF